MPVLLSRSPIIALVLLAQITGCSAKPPAHPVSDHFDGKHFFNPDLGPIDKSFWDLMKWQWGGTRAIWPDSIDVTPSSVPALIDERGERTASATFVNHATFVMRFAVNDSASLRPSSTTILVDPIWSKRASPLSWLGPRRHHVPGVRFEDLPRVDAVLVSHNHYDHMDMPTLVRLAKRDNPLFLVPFGDAVLLRDAGITRVEEMEWWESRVVSGVTITFLPSQHWSNRLGKARNTSLWGSWGMKAKRVGNSGVTRSSTSDSVSIYHAGDTGYGRFFAAIGARWGAPDLALLPIGAYKPRWFLKEQHMDPAEAVRAFQDLGAAAAVGMHFGTFRMADEPYGSPESDLSAAAGKDPFYIPKPGETFFTTK